MLAEELDYKDGNGGAMIGDIMTWNDDTFQILVVMHCITRVASQFSVVFFPLQPLESVVFSIFLLELKATQMVMPVE